MPRSIDPDILDGEVLTLATCYKITRTDGAVLGFTTHDDDLTFGGVTYQASAGMVATETSTSTGTGVDNVDVQAIVSSPDLDDDDLFSGLYDGALVELLLVDFTNLALGAVTLLKGTLGEVRGGRARFETELRSLSQQLRQNVGELTSPTCRVRELGDSRCKVSLAAFTRSSVAVTGVTNNRVFAAVGLAIDTTGYFKHGKLTWLTGNNAGLAREVKEFTTGTGAIELKEAMRLEVQVGDTFDIVAGCDRRLETCRDKFSNVVNFRGEPNMPGTDEVLKVGS